MGDDHAIAPGQGALAGHEDEPVGREVIATAPVFASPPDGLMGEPLLRLARHYGMGVDRCASCAALHGPTRAAQAA